MIIEKGDIVETEKGKAIVISTDYKSSTLVIEHADNSLQAMPEWEIRTVHRNDKTTKHLNP